MDRRGSEPEDNIISICLLELQLYLLTRRIINESTGCWTLGDNYNLNKYQSIFYDGETHKAYRLSARAFLNLDNLSMERDDIEICHKRYCPYKACFNPRHLYIGTKSSNRKDYWNSQRLSPQHCIHGHILSVSERTGRVYCKECESAYRKNRFNPSHIKYSKLDTSSEVR